MKKEPLGLYILRFIISAGLFIFLLMLYWSFTLIEEEVKSVNANVELLKEEILDIRSALEKSRGLTQLPTKQENSQSTLWPHMDPALPNLLNEDPFFLTTLPQLLGPEFKPEGTFHQNTLGRPETLHVFSNWAHISAWQSLCMVTVGRLKFGIFETNAPYMAVKMEERTNPQTGQTEFWVFLRDRVYWQPLRKSFFSEDIHLAPQFLKKHQVTAEDFKFYFDAMMNPYVQLSGAVANRTYYNDLEEIEVIDPLTFVAKWKREKIKNAEGKTEYKSKYVAKGLTGALRPLASFVYKYFADGTKIIDDDKEPDTYRTNSSWAQNFSLHWAKNVIVSCGAWTFDGMGDRQIKFKRNSEHFFPLDALADTIEVQFKDTVESMWQDFKGNKLDYYEVRPDQLLEFEEFKKTPQYQAQAAMGAGINRLDFFSYSYSYIGWNQTKPLFKSKRVRQALTMAIDRKRIIRQNLNGLGIEINGPFYYRSSAYDHAIPAWPYDPLQAKRILEEEGWYDADGDGILDKEIDGKRTPFRFKLTYYVKNPTSKSICEYVATALREIGIDVNLNGIDVADLTAAFEEKSFDALFLAWMLGTPPENPRQLWYSKGVSEKGSSNAIGFSNAEADAIIDALDYESDPEKRTALYHRFDQIIHDEAPYTFLYTPKTVLLYRNYIRNVFIPAERQDLIPGADVMQPDSSIYYISENGEHV